MALIRKYPEGNRGPLWHRSRKISIRNCYEDMYEEVSAAMQDTFNNRPAFHITGEPGIG